MRKKDKMETEEQIKNKEENEKKEEMESAAENSQETDSIANSDLEERIKELEETNKDLNDRLLRRIAEFENYKRRTEQDQLNLLKYASEPFITKILPIYDDLSRSLSHVDDQNEQSIKDGLKLIFDKFTKVLQEQGVERIKSKGEEFDFNYHEALLQQPTKEYPPNTVIQEVEAGYIYKDKVIKHAKVIVSQNPVEDESNENQSKSADEQNNRDSG